jgi:multidrug resistance efflux pump
MPTSAAPTTKRKRTLLLAAVVTLAVVIILASGLRSRRLLLTGIVTTDDVIVSSEIGGRLQQLTATQGDSVKRGQLLGVVALPEWKADSEFYQASERGAASQVKQAEADLLYQEAVTGGQIRQAEANLASAEDQARQADSDLENARLNFERETSLHQKEVDSLQVYDQARTGFDGAKAHSESEHKQVQAAQAALEMAKASASQVAVRRAALESSRHQLDASAAQRQKAEVQLGYTEVRAPSDGVVDVRAALQGEVVTPGQAIVTLINPDDLWVRVDVEESYIDRIHLGDKLPVRLPSGAEREGTVFFRGIDADYATQRDVSRTKRDIKTFEVRLRADNTDRALAVGMTAYVTLPFAR